MSDEQGGQENAMDELLKQLMCSDSIIRIQLNDKRIEDLAKYDVTRGFMQARSATPEMLQIRFREYKTLIKQGEYTLKSLEDQVYAKWGVSEEGREDVLNKIMDGKVKEKPITGFNIDDLEVKKMDENDERNH